MLVLFETPAGYSLFKVNLHLFTGLRDFSPKTTQNTTPPDSRAHAGTVVLVVLSEGTIVPW